MPPQTPSRRGKAIPLLLLCLGYLSIIPFGAGYLIFFTLQTGCVVRPFFIHDLIPLFGLILIRGYSRAVQGEPPWESPKLFWAASFFYNLIFFIFGILSIPTDFLSAMTIPVQSLRDTLHPDYDPKALIAAVQLFTNYFFLLAMPLVAALSALELVRASKAARKSQPATPEPAR